MVDALCGNQRCCNPVNKKAPCGAAALLATVRIGQSSQSMHAVTCLLIKARLRPCSSVGAGVDELKVRAVSRGQMHSMCQQEASRRVHGIAPQRAAMRCKAMEGVMGRWNACTASHQGPAGFTQCGPHPCMFCASMLQQHCCCL